MRYLGYVVSEAGVRADSEKVTDINNFPTPENVKALRSFLGLASYYYRRFTLNFARVAGPLYAFTKKDAPFVWTADCECALSELKGLLHHHLC